MILTIDNGAVLLRKFTKLVVATCSELVRVKGALQFAEARLKALNINNEGAIIKGKGVKSRA